MLAQSNDVKWLNQILLIIGALGQIFLKAES